MGRAGRYRRLPRAGRGLALPGPRAMLRVETLTLAAPDLDFSVVGQRLIAERFGPAFGRITVYINPGDSALGLAQAVLAGTRFGRIRNVHFINVSAVTDASSHGDFRDNPDLLRDMAQVITADAAPDSPARNLLPDEGNFWRLVQEGAGLRVFNVGR